MRLYTLISKRKQNAQDSIKTLPAILMKNTKKMLKTLTFQKKFFLFTSMIPLQK